ncbi:MAG: hypothetical protein JNJ83_06880 [Verrucomicrobiaceae bacterium]|nr:hypothetical protein [Verrucomicrobiaceae bacterium]
MSRLLTLAACLLVLGVVVVNTFLARNTAETPTFAWSNDPDPAQLYDVWVLPPSGDHETTPPLFTLKGTRSPIKLAEMKPAPEQSPKLEKTGRYRLLVCLASAGKFSGQPVDFTVEPQITVPGPSPATMLQILIAGGRIQDAHTLVNALPPTVRSRPEVQTLLEQLPP